MKVKVTLKEELWSTTAPLRDNRLPTNDKLFTDYVARKLDEDKVTTAQERANNKKGV